MSSINWQQFAEITIKTGDLDPMYQLIYNGRMKYGEDWAFNYALFFFMFYDAGQAAAMANAQTELDFWHMVNFGFDGFKRGTERRHFRGEKARNAMLKFQHTGSPKKVWNLMADSNVVPWWSSAPGVPSYTRILANINNYFPNCQIGPYFAWKAMDLLDRALGKPVRLSLDEALKHMPDEPRAAARHFFPEMTLSEVVIMITGFISQFPAQGEPNRPCGFAEAETILCMMKGFFKTKTHTIGDDIAEKHAQLSGYYEPTLTSLLPRKLTQDEVNEYVKAMVA